jgi:Zn-dependent peptidase ImmA (M78 family)
MTIPPLPATVMAPGGPITVTVVAKLQDAGEDLWGVWKLDERAILIQRHRNKKHMWSTLYHELVHAALDDSGLSNMLTDQQQEMLCDAMATARMRERFG